MVKVRKRMADIELYPTRERRRRLERAGLSGRAERGLNTAMAVTVALFVTGWAFTVAQAATTDVPLGLGGRVTANPLSPSAPPETAFLLDAALRRLAASTELYGESGDVRVLVQQPGDTALPVDVPEEGVALTAEADPEAPELLRLVARIGEALRPVPRLTILRMVPITERVGGAIRGYRVGEWPYERGGTPDSPEYAPPAGLVEVKRDMLDLPVSTHFTLGDFLTKGQENVWPKFVLVSPRLLDKLELTIDELEAMGHPVRDVGIISGFRHPHYNEAGGNPAGRGALSRHMYGDAMDWFVDNDGNGSMDDLNGDGRVDVADARIIAEAGERVERKYPHLVGGIGIYRPTGAHNGFVHLDTRGYRARW